MNGANPGGQLLKYYILHDITRHLADAFIHRDLQ